MKNVVLLGSTGSIGTSTVKVAEDLPDRIRLVGLAAGNNAALLLEQTLKHRPEAISLADPAKAAAVKAFVNYGLTTGQEVAPELGYISLPDSVVKTLQAALEGVK